MPEKLRLGLIFGGRSTEHEVSVVSAQHVIAAADRERFEVVPIGVSRSGVWLTRSRTEAAMERPDPPFRKQVTSSSDHGTRDEANSDAWALKRARGRGIEALRDAFSALHDVDVVFPLIHGTHGEDGTLQGLLELAGVPYVGCGVAASAIGMDKDLMKSLFRAAGIPVADYFVLRLADWSADPLAAARNVEDRIPYPAFVKPANGGSSVGVSKVRGREDLVTAVAEAGRYDAKVIVENAITGREVECAVLGNANAEASPVGEIKYTREFYDYEAKYLDPTTEIIAPADIPPDIVARVQEQALRAFRAIDGAGMSRVDFFLKPDGELVIDEINTIPGFTPASMYPRLWQAARVSYSSLVSRLVDFALARHRERPIV